MSLLLFIKDKIVDGEILIEDDPSNYLYQSSGPKHTG